MVESNVVTVTYQPTAVAISLNLTVDRTIYDLTKDYLNFIIQASADASGRTVELYVDGQATGRKATFSGQGTSITCTPNNYPSQLQSAGSHNCKVNSVGW